MSKFKVGDFVRWPHMSLIRVFKIDNFDGEKYHLENMMHWISPIELTLWEPHPGEWCWFWDSDDDIASLGQFFSTNKGRYESSAFAGSRCEFCEPFIGTLPSKTKEH